MTPEQVAEMRREFAEKEAARAEARLQAAANRRTGLTGVYAAKIEAERLRRAGITQRQRAVEEDIKSRTNNETLRREEAMKIELHKREARAAEARKIDAYRKAKAEEDRKHRQRVLEEQRRLELLRQHQARKVRR